MTTLLIILAIYGLVITAIAVGFAARSAAEFADAEAVWGRLHEALEENRILRGEVRRLEGEAGAIDERHRGG
jgi:hypothetical protein